MSQWYITTRLINFISPSSPPLPPHPPKKEEILSSPFPWSIYFLVRIRPWRSIRQSSGSRRKSISSPFAHLTHRSRVARWDVLRPLWLHLVSWAKQEKVNRKSIKNYFPVGLVRSTRFCLSLFSIRYVSLLSKTSGNPAKKVTGWKERPFYAAVGNKSGNEGKERTKSKKEEIAAPLSSSARRGKKNLQP